MSVFRYEDIPEIRVSDTTSIAFQELEEEGASLEQQEAMLDSDAEVIHMTGKRLAPRLLKR